MGQGAAVAGFQRVDRHAVAAQQVEADTQPHGGGRRAVFALFQFVGRFAEDAVVRRVVADGVDELLNLMRTERAVGDDDLLDIRGG
ncbi:MAG: hypothetical protein QM811_05655 [Pirellulales bacterium]